LSDIGRALGRHAATIYGVLLTNGGFTPPERRRSSRHLSLAEREDILCGITLGHSFRQIAEKLGRAPSSISREVNRNGGRARYRATRADSRAQAHARRPKPCLLATNAKLRQIVARKLKIEWSPEQIAGWLKRVYPGHREMHISHETIYRSLFIQARGVLKKELLAHLRSKRVIRQSKYYNTKGSIRGHIIDGVSIRERPVEVEDRAVPGHWEGDLIAGSNNTHIATLVERQSRFTILIKVNGKDTQTVVLALTQQVKKLPRILRQSLTWDRGMELANHKEFTIDTQVKVYFCDPKSPWQRGSNENTNRLLRQYFPKKTDLSVYSQADLNKVALRLNQRPRKTLGFHTPADILQETVAMTG
jgi:IS30 family transposase